MLAAAAAAHRQDSAHAAQQLIDKCRQMQAGGQPAAQSQRQTLLRQQAHRWHPAPLASRHEQTPSTRRPQHRARAHRRCTATVSRHCTFGRGGALHRRLPEAAGSRHLTAAQAVGSQSCGTLHCKVGPHARPCSHLQGPRRTSYSSARTTRGVTSGSRSGSSRPRRASSARPRHPPCQAVSLAPAGAGPGAHTLPARNLAA